MQMISGAVLPIWKVGVCCVGVLLMLILLGVREWERDRGRANGRRGRGQGWCATCTRAVPLWCFRWCYSYSRTRVSRPAIINTVRCLRSSAPPLPHTHFFLPQNNPKQHHAITTTNQPTNEQLLHEVVSKSVHGRNAEGQKKRTVNVQRGHLVNGDPVIGMTMLKEDYE